MTRILFIRHGKTQWNLEKRLQGRRDIPLCDRGIALLERCSLPEEFKSYNWSVSPLKRAQETARLLGACNFQLEPALVEMDWGDWEGYTVKELRQIYGTQMDANEARGRNMLPPGGESPAMVMDRITPWLRGLRQNTIAVTHKGIIRAAKSLAYNWDMTDKSPVAFDWTAAHLFRIDAEGRLSPERVNISLET
jgi:2,3-bisphosphoglycerate-dependent phosphoglycerate mutase